LLDLHRCICYIIEVAAMVSWVRCTVW